MWSRVMSQAALTHSMALSDRYFAIEPWLIGALFATSGALAIYLIGFLLSV
jgi:hypothetical protein